MPEDSVKLPAATNSTTATDVNTKNPTIPSSYFPIKEITPYHRGWVIKARVMSRSDVRDFQRKGNMGKGDSGSGKVFSVDLVDKEGSEIRASFFNEGCQKFDPIIKVGKVYQFGKGEAKVSNKLYSQVDHEYELVFGRADCNIMELEDDGEISAQTIYSFQGLNHVKTKTVPFNCDIIGVVSSVSEIRTWTKEMKSYSKYSFLVADETENMLDVSIFGESMITKYPRESITPGCVVALKGVTVKEFQGRSGILQTSGLLEVNPTTNTIASKRCEELQKWWTNGGKTKQLQSMTDVTSTQGGSATASITVATLKDDVEVEDHEKPVYNDIVVHFAKCLTTSRGQEIPIYYDACPKQVSRPGAPSSTETMTCNKKCENSVCPEHGTVATAKRWMTRCVFEDHTDNAWLQCFDADFAAICGKNASEMDNIPTGEALQKWVDSFNFNQLFRIRVRTKVEEYMGERRGRSNITSINKMDYVKDTREMLKSIKEMI